MARALTLSIACTLGLLACASRPRTATSRAQLALCSAAQAAPERSKGAEHSLHLLTYNVGGLPQWLSKTRPRDNLARIGELISSYDLVLTQEDFAYPDLLREKVRFQQQTRRSGRHGVFSLGSGLSRFSHQPFRAEEHVSWEDCSGYLRRFSDCLAPKGFTFATHVLDRGIEIDVYNVHLDAGSSERDIKARRRQVLQIARFIQERSRDKAVIIAGDSNLRLPRDRAAYQNLLRWTLTTDACLALGCREGAEIDRVLFRSSRKVQLKAVNWRQPPCFVDRTGEPLSDHPPVAVTFRVRSKTQH